MFLADSEFDRGVIKNKPFMGKTYLYDLLTRAKIKQHLLLGSPFTSFIQIVIELRIRKSCVFNFSKK